MKDKAPNIFGISHIGGDRFAANVVLLPTGHVFGRLDDCDDATLEKLLVKGVLPVENLRGKIGLTPAENVAESWYRTNYGVFELEADIYARSKELGDEVYEVIVEDRSRVVTMRVALEEQSEDLIKNCGQSKVSALKWEIKSVSERKGDSSRGSPINA